MRIRVGLCLPVAVSPDGSRKGENRRTPLVLLTLASALATWNIKWRGSLVAPISIFPWTRPDFMRQPGFLPVSARTFPRAWSSPRFCFSRKISKVFVAMRFFEFFFFFICSIRLFLIEDGNKFDQSKGKNRLV